MKLPNDAVEVVSSPSSLSLRGILWLLPYCTGTSRVRFILIRFKKVFNNPKKLSSEFINSGVEIKLDFKWAD